MIHRPKVEYRIEFDDGGTDAVVTWKFELQETGRVYLTGYRLDHRPTKRHKWRMVEGFGTAVESGYRTSHTNPMFKNAELRPRPTEDLIQRALNDLRAQIVWGCM